MSELYELPNGWEWKELNSLAKFQSGGTPKRSNKSYWNGDIPWVKISDINDNMYVDSTVEFITKDGLDNSSAKLFSKGTILYTIFATIGKIGILNIEATTNQAISGITPNKNTDTFYMYYGLKFITNEIKKISTGVAQNNINLTKLKAQFLPIPPLPEQQRIVSKLDNLFEIIDKSIALHQKNMDDADVFMGSVLNDVFEELEQKYEKRKINKISTVKGGKRVPKGYKLTEKVTPYPYLRVTDFKYYGTVCKEKMLYLTEEVYQQIKRYTITDENLYITNVGNTIGKSGIIPSDLNGANLTENAVKLVYKDKKNTSNKFMYYFTKSSIFISQMELATKRMAVPKLAIMRLGEIATPFPPINIQQKTVAYLDDISKKTEKIKSVQKEKMENLISLKASILDRAFRGKL